MIIKIFQSLKQLDIFQSGKEKQLTPNAREQVRDVPAAPCAPLPDLQAVHPQDGPPLSLDQQLRGRVEPEVLPAVPLLRRRPLRLLHPPRGRLVVLRVSAVPQRHHEQAGTDQSATRFRSLPLHLDRPSDG